MPPKNIIKKPEANIPNIVKINRAGIEATASLTKRVFEYRLPQPLVYHCSFNCPIIHNPQAISHNFSLGWWC